MQIVILKCSCCGAVKWSPVLFEYQWPRTERVQGCSLTPLCLSSAASDLKERSGGIIRLRLSLGTREGDTSQPGKAPSGKAVQLTRRQ